MSVKISPELECPIDVYCSPTLGGVSENCYVSHRLNPLPLAEEICYSALFNRIRGVLPSTPAKLYSRANFLLECALANEDSEESARQYDDSANYLEQILIHPDTAIPLYIGARVLEAALPLFRARQSNEDPSDTALAAVHLNYASYLEWVLNADCFSDDGEREYAILLGVQGCLGNRNREIDIAVYPGTLRESKLGGPEFSHLHHQFYGIRHGHKVPVTAYMNKKSGSHDRHEMVKIHYPAFIRSGARILRAKGIPASSDIAVMQAPELLIADARGEKISGIGQELLLAWNGLFLGKIGSLAAIHERQRNLIRSND